MARLVSCCLCQLQAARPFQGGDDCFLTAAKLDLPVIWLLFASLHACPLAATPAPREPFISKKKSRILLCTFGYSKVHAAPVGWLKRILVLSNGNCSVSWGRKPEQICHSVSQREAVPCQRRHLAKRICNTIRASHTIDMMSPTSSYRCLVPLHVSPAWLHSKSC